jgi:zinc and cadmium transporter
MTEYLLIIYCSLILLASLAGGWIPLLITLTHRRMEIAVSFVAGVMLGVALLHMLPHALSGGAAVQTVMLWLLGGFLVMFFTQRYFSYHHHGVPNEKSCDELQHDPNEHEHAHGHQLSWSAAMVGLSLHSVIAGVALAASVEAERHDAHGFALAGLGTFLVIFLHKPFDSMTIGTLMAVGNRPTRMRHLVNSLFALAIPLGALLFHVGLLSTAQESSLVVQYALAFSAGTFLCISLSDLLPELHFHQHDRFKLSAALLCGLLLAWGISIFEAKTHDHDHTDPAPAKQIETSQDTDLHDHDHDHGHDH